MQIKATKITGCFEVKPEILRDNRGIFVKILNKDVFKKHGLATVFNEEYFSCSKKNVLRGLHFQLPPYDHIKMVYCVYGKVLDAIVDLRKNSQTFGKHAVFELSDKNAKALYLAKGIAHGYYVLSDEAIIMYKVTTAYSPRHDCGILWNSANIPWPNNEPILSDRDKRFPLFGEFESPFIYLRD